MDEVQYDEESAIYDHINTILQSSDIQALLAKIQLTTEEIQQDLNSRDAFVIPEEIDDIQAAKQYIHYIVYMKLLENFRTQITEEQQNEVPEQEDEFADEFADLDENLDSEGMLDATLKYGIFPYIEEDGILPVPMTNKQKEIFKAYVSKIKAVLNKKMNELEFVRNETEEEHEISVEDLPGFDIDEEAGVATQIDNLPENTTHQVPESPIFNEEGNILASEAPIFDDLQVGPSLATLADSRMDEGGIAALGIVAEEMASERGRDLGLTEERNKEDKDTEEFQH